MNNLKEMLRMRYEARLSLRQIALCLSLSIGVISRYLKRADGAGIGWPLPKGMSDEALERLLQPAKKSVVSLTLAEPDFPDIAQELPQKGMTRLLLWQEYAQAHPDNHYSYSRFGWRKYPDSTVFVRSALQ